MIDRLARSPAGLALFLVPTLLASTLHRVAGQEPEPPSGERGSPDLEELGRLYAARDYFALRERLSEGKAPHIELLAHHYVSGKPTDVLELKTPRPVLATIAVRN